MAPPGGNASWGHCPTGLFSYTNKSLVTLSAEAVDNGAGVIQNDMFLNVSATLPVGNPVYAPIVDGFRVTRASSIAIPEGAKSGL